MIIINSSPIIFLAKQGNLQLFKKCFKNAIISKSVYEEIKRKSDNLEFISLEKAIRDGWIRVEPINVLEQLDTKSLGKGEKESISLAAKHRCLLIIDDDLAKQYASIFGIEAHGALFVVNLAYLKKIISKESAINIFKTMIKDGFYITPELYAKFIDLLKSNHKK